jgi:hypothetical protein
MPNNVFTQLFIDSFVKGVGKTSGALVTIFVGWQMCKVTNVHKDFLSFLLGKRSKKRRIELPSIILNTGNEQELSEPDHEEINLEDMENEIKFKTLFDRLA